MQFYKNTEIREKLEGAYLKQYFLFITHIQSQLRTNAKKKPTPPTTSVLISEQFMTLFLSAIMDQCIILYINKLFSQIIKVQSPVA